LKLYGVAPHNYNASHWYRTMLPWRTAHRMGIADTVIDSPEIKVPREDERRAIATMYADIIQHYQNYSQGFKFSRDTAATFPSYWESKEHWNFGPNFVFDTDDDLFRVEPLNPAFRDLGTNWQGQTIPRGHQVTIEVPGAGRQVLFADGKEGFSVEANMKKQAALRDNIIAADLVTTTTHRCASYVARESGRGDIHVYPNCIDFSDWPRVDLAQDEKVRILWESSHSHFEDMWPYATALGEVQKKYPNVEIILFGAPYKWLREQLVEERTTCLPWTTYSNYIWRLSTLNMDINLAPLHDSEFNRCRSAIRMYEPAACWKPAATLAENTGAFADEIIEGETGMLFSTVEEFKTKLSGLIEDSVLRKQIAANAKDWVRTNRDPMLHVPKLIEAYQRLRDIRRSVSVPPPPIEEEEVTADVSVPAIDPDVRECEDAGSPASQ
jgi:glycosyltransferase involved in cell wall biosynthesis